MRTFAARRWTLALSALAAGLLLVAAWQVTRVALRPSAMYTGWLLLALVLGLTLLNARKQVPFLPLLSASAWLQAHVYVGWITCLVFFLHGGLRLPAGRLEGALAAVFLVVAASGAAGLWLSRWLPPRLARSGESLVYERIPLLRHRLREEARDLVRRAELETKSTSLSDFYLRVLHPYFLRTPRLFAPFAGDDPAYHQVTLELGEFRRFLDAREVAFADQVAGLLEAKRNLDAQHAGQRLLKLWLFAHLPLTYVLLVLIAAHVWLVLQYSPRL